NASPTSGWVTSSVSTPPLLFSLFNGVLGSIPCSSSLATAHGLSQMRRLSRPAGGAVPIAGRSTPSGVPTVLLSGGSMIFIPFAPRPLLTGVKKSVFYAPYATPFLLPLVLEPVFYLF